MRRIQAALVILLLLAAASSAFAQYEEDKPSKFGIRVMNFLPLGGKLRDIESVWLGPAIDYHQRLDEDGRPVSLVSFGMMSSGDGPERASEVQITRTRLRRTQFAETRSRYTGYGLGLYRLAHRRSASWARPAVDEASIKPAIHLIYGQEYKDAYFAEIRLDMLPKWQNMNWNGIYLCIGTRITL